MKRNKIKLNYTPYRCVFTSWRARQLRKKENKDTDKRMEYAQAILGDEYIYNEEQLSKLEKILNPDNQLQMTRLCDFMEENSDIPFELILGRLADLKYLKSYCYDIKEACTCEFMYITKKPYIDYVIIPTFSDGDYPYLVTLFIVISKDVETDLQQYCNAIREKYDGSKLEHLMLLHTLGKV